jgi:hypothetical protein
LQEGLAGLRLRGDALADEVFRVPVRAVRVHQPVAVIVQCRAEDDDVGLARPRRGDAERAEGGDVDGAGEQLELDLPGGAANPLDIEAGEGIARQFVDDRLPNRAGAAGQRQGQVDRGVGRLAGAGEPRTRQAGQHRPAR